MSLPAGTGPRHRPGLLFCPMGMGNSSACVRRAWVRIPSISGIRYEDGATASGISLSGHPSRPPAWSALYVALYTISASHPSFQYADHVFGMLSSFAKGRTIVWFHFQLLNILIPTEVTLPGIVILFILLSSENT